MSDRIPEEKDDYRPNRESLSNAEIIATGLLGGGAVSNIAREAIASRVRIAALTSALADANAKLSALQWQEITPENLPEVGDEIWGEKTGVMRKEYIPNPAKMDDAECARLWIWAGWTHFRPITAPQPKGAA